MNHKHPSGIDLSCVPGDHVLRCPTAKSVLRELAVELQAWMRCTAQDIVTHCEQLDPLKAYAKLMAYNAIIEMYDMVCRQWKACEFDGDPQPSKVYTNAMAHVSAIMRERNEGEAF